MVMVQTKCRKTKEKRDAGKTRRNGEGSRNFFSHGIKTHRKCFCVVQIAEKFEASRRRIRRRRAST